MIRQVQSIGRFTLYIVGDAGRATVMLFRALVRWPEFPGGFQRLLRQLYFTGVLSFIIIFLSGLFIGMVLGLQGHTILVKFGAEQALGQLIALSLVRELGPVVAALLF